MFGSKFLALLSVGIVGYVNGVEICEWNNTVTCLTLRNCGKNSYWKVREHPYDHNIKKFSVSGCEYIKFSGLSGYLDFDDYPILSPIGSSALITSENVPTNKMTFALEYFEYDTNSVWPAIICYFGHTCSFEFDHVSCKSSSIPVFCWGNCESIDYNDTDNSCLYGIGKV